MATIKVVRAFSLLLAPNQTATRFEIGEHEVEQDIAEHWYVREHIERDGSEAADPAALAGFDPETATRDEHAAFVRSRFEAYLASLSDEELADFAAREHRRALDRAEEHDGDEGDDTVTSTAGEDTLSGGEGNDTMSGQASEAAPAGVDAAAGDTGADSLTAPASADAVSGDGEDKLPADAGQEDAAEQTQPDNAAGEDTAAPKKARGQGGAKA